MRVTPILITGTLVIALTGPHVSALVPKRLTQQGTNSATEMSAVARQYWRAALDIIRSNSRKQRELNWDALEVEALRDAERAQVPADTYGAIRKLLASVDSHSGFFDPQMMAGMNQRTAAMSPPAEGRLLPERLGYVLVTQFASLDQTLVDAYATRLQQIIKTVDAQEPCAWIVDLRQNGGGNTWAMLAGLGPLLDNGKVGAFINADGSATGWSYNEGQALFGTRPFARTTEAPYYLRRPASAAAVLTSATTASSGEAVAVAFRGRPATRVFGQPTRGLSTSNTPFLLSDGAMINLTTAVFADREGREYPNGIEPDEQIPVSDSAAIPGVALDWLRQQPSCNATP